MGPRVFHAKFQPDRPKEVGLTTSGGQQLLGEQLISSVSEIDEAYHYHCCSYQSTPVVGRTAFDLIQDGCQR